MEESDKQSQADKVKKDKKKTRNGVREKIFKCTGYEDCNMVFNRAEHLARHIRKHTGERPFQCYICFKYFSRLDNLKQHIENVHSKIENMASILKSHSRIQSGQFNFMNGTGINNTFYLNQPYYQYPYHSNGIYYNYVAANDNMAIPNNTATHLSNTHTPRYFNGYHSHYPIDSSGTNSIPPSQSYITTKTTAIADAGLHNNITNTSGIANNNLKPDEGTKVSNNIPTVNPLSNSTPLTDNSHKGIISKTNVGQPNSHLPSLSTVRSMDNAPLPKNNGLEKEQSPAPSVLSTDSSSLGYNTFPGEKFRHNPYNTWTIPADGQIMSQQNNIAIANNTTTNYSFYPYNMISDNLQINPNWVTNTSQPSAVGSISSTPTTTTSTSHDKNIKYVSNGAPFNNSLPYQAILQQPKTITALPVQLEREKLVSVPSIYQEINSKMKMNESQTNENNTNINQNQFTNVPYYLLSSFQTIPYQTGHPHYQAQSTVPYNPIQPSVDLLNINHNNSVINNVFSNLTINNKSNDPNSDKNKIYDAKRTFTKNSATYSSTPSLDSKSIVASESSSSIVSSATSSTTGRSYKNSIDGGNVHLSSVKDDVLKNNSHKRKLPDISSSSSSGNSSNNNSSGNSNYSGSSSSDNSSDVNESNIQDIEAAIHEDGDERIPKSKECAKKHNSSTSKKSKKKDGSKSKSKSNKSKSKSGSKPHKKRSKKKSTNEYFNEDDLRRPIINGSSSSLESSVSAGETYDTTTAKIKDGETKHKKTKEKKKEDKFNETDDDNNTTKKKKTKDTEKDPKFDDEPNKSTTTSRLSLDYIIS